MATSARTRSAQNHGALAGQKGNGQPAAFDLDAFQAEAVQEPFRFTLGGRQFELPHLLDLDWHGGLGDDGDPGGATVHKIIRTGLGGQWKDFDRCQLTAAGYNKLWEKWREHSGVEAGESPASPVS